MTDNDPRPAFFWALAATVCTFIVAISAYNIVLVIWGSE